MCTKKKPNLALFEQVLGKFGLTYVFEAGNGSGGRTRTCDLMINSHLLCQLSYAGTADK